jgi:hypothetical protein
MWARNTLVSLLGYCTTRIYGITTAGITQPGRQKHKTVQVMKLHSTLFATHSLHTDIVLLHINTMNKVFVTKIGALVCAEGSAMQEIFCDWFNGMADRDPPWVRSRFRCLRETSSKLECGAALVGLVVDEDGVSARVDFMILKVLCTRPKIVQITS